MSTKKSFSISAGLTSGLKTSIQSATVNSGKIHYDMMTLDKIETDPENPRRLLISSDEVVNGLNKTDPYYSQKAAELQLLQELAESIKSVGVRNAVEVYKDGDIYRLISGERRFLASLLAGKEYIPVRISQKMDMVKLRYIQWVENINRQDLSLWEKHKNLILMSEAHEQTKGNKITEEQLQILLGVSHVQAFRYYCLLKADAKVIALVKVGKITSLKQVQELTSIKNNSEKQRNLEKLLKELEEGGGDSHMIKKMTSAAKAKGTPSISLGKTVNPSIARYLMDTLTQQPEISRLRPEFNKVNWESTKDINRVFKKLIFFLEKNLPATETCDVE